MKSQIESGVELFSRLNDKPSLRGLEDTLFPEGPQNTDVVEISGESSTGKTLLLSRMLANCILPNSHRLAGVQGCDASAVLINTDHHFQVSKLVEWMSDAIDRAEPSARTHLFSKSDIIENCLRKLRVVDCYDSEQFSLTLHALDDAFLDTAKIAVIAIDSLTAYYWQDRENNVITIDAYVKKLLNVVRARSTRFNVLTVYTRQSESTPGKANKATKTAGNLDYRVYLQKVRDSKDLTCRLETPRGTTNVRYSISDKGIEWKTDQGEG